MKRILAIYALCVAASWSLAGDISSTPYAFTVGANAAVTGTNYFNCKGAIKEIQIACPASATGDVRFVIVAANGTTQNVWTNPAVVASTTFRPRVAVVDNVGAAITGSIPVEYLLAGEQLRVTIANVSVTGITWKVAVKTER
jgi:hypothetical protein